jgi:hypothetical protein
MPLGGPHVVEATIGDVESLRLSPEDQQLVYEANVTRVLGLTAAGTAAEL